MDVDADGYPHISYYDDCSDELKYAHYGSIGQRRIFLPLVVKE
jgi:hypothetical protein